MSHVPQSTENYIKIHAWQVMSIKKTVKKASSKQAKFIGHDDVADWLKSWGKKIPHHILNQ